MQMKISSAKWRPFCPRGDELRYELTETRKDKYNDVNQVLTNDVSERINVI